QNGKMFWQTELGGEPLNEIIFDSENVFAATRITRLDPLEGNVVKTTSSGKNLKSSVTIFSLGRNTGITKWQQNLPIDQNNILYFLETTEKLFILTEEGRVFVLSKKDGTVISEKKLGFGIKALPYQAGEKVFFGTSEDDIYQMNL